MKLSNQHRRSNHGTRIQHIDAATDDNLALALPAVDDARSIQRAISTVLQALAAGALDAARARALLYGLQIAATNARHLAASQASRADEASAAVEAADNDMADNDAATANESESMVPPLQTSHMTAVAETDAPASEEKSLPISTSASADNAVPVSGYVNPARERLMLLRRRKRLVTL